MKQKIICHIFNHLFRGPYVRTPGYRMIEFFTGFNADMLIGQKAVDIPFFCKSTQCADTVTALLLVYPVGDLGTAPDLQDFLPGAYFLPLIYFKMGPRISQITRIGLRIFNRYSLRRCEK